MGILRSCLLRPIPGWSTILSLDLDSLDSPRFLISRTHTTLPIPILDVSTYGTRPYYHGSARR